MWVLYHSEKTEYDEAHKVEKNYLENRQIESQKYRCNSNKEKGFIVNRWQKSFCEKNQNGEREDIFRLEPRRIPPHIHRHTKEYGQEDEKYLLCVEVKWPDVHNLN